MIEKKLEVMDGNTAAAYVSYAFTEVAAIYPITPSSPMAEKVDEWSAHGKTNIFGKPVNVIEIQSEAVAAGTCHGSLQAGALTTTYTASQGLMLMIPGMYAIGGQFLPHVIHIAARAVGTHAASIFGDHTDIMTCRTTGYAMLISSSPQECMDMAAVAHLSAIKGPYAFMHCFDGFRTSHEMQRIEVLDYNELEKLVDYEKLAAFRKHALNPEHPSTRGTTMNPDVFFQCREGANVHSREIPGIVQSYMDEINKMTGRDYKLFNYYGASDATEMIVIMGSGSETVCEVVDYLNANGRKVGMIQVHLFRPFAVEKFAGQIPATVKKIAVLDRSKEVGSVGEPLYLDVCSALRQCGRNDITVVGGRYGLASKDATPGQFIAVYDNLLQDAPKNSFTIGIEDDVTYTSLDYKDIVLDYPGRTSCKMWGPGGDGTVGANKNAISTIGLTANMYVQAYFSYDSMKSGGLTQSHLRFGDKPIKSAYLVSSADFVAVHAPTYVNKYDTTSDLKDGGTYLLNCPWTVDELEDRLPGKMKRDLYNKRANFYILDATKLAEDIGLGKHSNNVLQAAFFKLADIIPIELAVEEMKKSNYKTYFKKAGQDVVDLNDKAVEVGLSGFVKVDMPESWATAPDKPETEINATRFVKELVIPMDRQEGNKIPVSKLMEFGCLDGTWENGTSAYSKRGVATKVPSWDPEKCAQCNRCAMACPHAAIRPVLLTEEENKGVPEGFVTVPAKGGTEFKDYFFRMQVSPFDCLGCGVCLTACPVPGALTMADFESQKKQQEFFDDYAMNEDLIKKDVVSDKSVKNIQFAKPYFQFSAACGGCAETTYIKLISQLFGDRMYIANAAGCSSAYGAALPITPYSCDKRGHGPAWQLSLFEDNAEFAYGFFMAQDTVRSEIFMHLDSLKNKGIAVSQIEEYLASWKDGRKTTAVSNALADALKDVDDPDAAFVIKNKEYLTKKSVWAFGGDGWAYDIGFGGLDHVVAQNRDVNILVLDTEVYSNTGGQSSKSTPSAAVAKFAAGGKVVRKKDLGAILMNYGYVYVAQVAMGFDQAQTLKAIREAEAYPGPSVIIAYCPCLEHGIRSGMGSTQQEMKKAVECGYWQTYRYDPRLAADGKNPFQLDSPQPDPSKMMDYFKGENRYASLANVFPEKAPGMYETAIKQAIERYEKYRKMAE